MRPIRINGLAILALLVAGVLAVVSLSFLASRPGAGAIDDYAVVSLIAPEPVDDRDDGDGATWLVARVVVSGDYLIEPLEWAVVRDDGLTTIRWVPKDARPDADPAGWPIVESFLAADELPLAVAAIATGREYTLPGFNGRLTMRRHDPETGPIPPATDDRPAARAVDCAADHPPEAAGDSAPARRALDRLGY